MNKIKLAEKSARIYDILIWIFSTLPDEAFMEKMRSDNVTALLDMHDGMTSEFSNAVKLIKKYLKSYAKKNDKASIEALAVDRTKLLRNPYENDFRPPYESQYRKDLGVSEIILELQNIYSEAGLAQSSNQESNDFILIELDFIKQLLKKAAEDEANSGKYLQTAKAFLENHLVLWFPSYCKIASGYAETDFYKGWLGFLNEFIKLNRGILSLDA